LNRTIANFLNLSRIEEGILTLKIEQFNPCEAMCKHAVQRLSELIADNKMSVDCKIDPELNIKGDITLLASVFINLISNAVKYGETGSKIITDCVDKDNEFELSVYNEGIGFSEKEAKGLFTKFSRFSSENYSTKSGTGLGLFVAKMIIEKHGGKIWAESEKGKWAIFSFTIPKNL
jgi:signal transduction histidine kinase